MGEDARPDPDALLRRALAQAERETQAKLKIFFGFAPGVGKTYRMLQVARELAALGRELLVGIVETHGRSETAALLEGLAILPRRQVTYRGRLLEEFDLDAALAQKPSLVVVDELAHTNAEGSRHGKRWQDVLDLLDAGIDVFTTVNVQHVESLNDVIEQITRIQVRETIPDLMLERADEIELIDISPDQLLQRLQEGKVYLPEQAVRAATHFFRRGNLLALRELALRRTAEHVDADVQDYREEHDVDRTWPTSERVLVSVSSAPASAKLVRAAKRIADGLRAPWVAAYVDASSRPPLRDADTEQLERNLRLAESLGATVVHLSGSEVAEPLLAYARRHNVTRLIIGKPAHPLLLDRIRGSLLDEIVRASGDIDVHVISGDSSLRDEPSVPPLGARQSVLRPYLITTVLVALTTAIGLLARRAYPVPDLEMLYLLPVMIAAFQFGRGPSLVAAALAVAAYDFFFVEPYLNFAVHDVRYVLTFLTMFLVGTILSTLTVRIKRQERYALDREERAMALHSLSRSLGALLDPAQAAEVVARHAADSFEAGAAILTPDTSGELTVIAAHPKDLSLGPTEHGVAKWVITHGRLAGLGTDTLPGSRAVCAELRVGPIPLGVLALVPRHGGGLTSEQRSFLEVFCRQAAFAFERSRLSDQARTSALHAKTEELRSSLLSAVSHDLRTPLAVITGAATTLRAGTTLSTSTRDELTQTICEEAERLERLVANLLEMTRLETGGLVPKREWVPLDEIVGAALTRLEDKLGDRPIDIDIAADLPLLSVDPVLLEQVFLNLLENAAKYTPMGSPLEVRAHTIDGKIEIVFSDRGHGLPAGDEARIFEKFYRGAHVGIGGVGLGLPICRGIIEGHGGAISAENRLGGGARFRISLPLVEGAPVPEEENGHGGT